FERWRPRVLVVEATRPGIRPDWSNPEAIGTWHAWEPALLARGYVFAHFDGLNRFYVRGEEQHLAARLRLPPGVFDDIEESGLNAGRSHRLATHLEAIESDRRLKDEVIGRLTTQLEAVENDRRLKDEVIGRLTGQLEAVESDRHLKDEVIGRL